MKKIVAIAVVVVIVAAGGAYYFVRQRAGQQMDAALAAFRESLPPGSTFTYADAAPDVFQRSAHLTTVALTTNGTAYTADTVDLAPGDGRTLRHFAMTKVTAKAPGSTATADSIGADGLTLPLLASSATQIDPAAVTFDHAALHGLHASPQGGGSIDATDISADGYGTGRPTTVDLAGLLMQPTGVAVDRVSLDHFRLRGILLADIVARAESGAGAWPRNNKDYGAELTSLAVNAKGKPLMTLGSFTAGSDPAGNDRLNTRMDMKDLVVMADPVLTPGLTQLGYDRFQGSMQMRATVDEAGQQLRMQAFDVDAPAMAHLHLALGLDNVPFGAMNQSASMGSAAALVALVQARLQSLDIVYDDHSFAAKATALAASQAGVSVDQFKQMQQAQLDAVAAQGKLPPAVVDPVRAFLKDPHRLSISVKPPQPIALGSLMAVAADPQRMLGLTVTN